MNQSRFIAAFALLFSSACAQLMESTPAPKDEVYNLSQGQAVPVAAKNVGLPLYIFGEGPGKAANYVPSGYMGDSGSLKMLSADFSAPVADGRTGQAALKIDYSPRGAAGWAGVYWLAPANNWAKIKGAGYNVSGSPRLIFWAKGEKGGERLSEVKIGGIVGPYPDTAGAGLQGVKLTSEWKRYEIDLAGKDLRHIVGGFMFSVRRADNPRGAFFYLDEIYYDAGEQTASPVEETPAVPIDAAPADSSVPPTPIDPHAEEGQ